MWLINPALLLNIIDIGLAGILIFVILLSVQERRILQMVWGFSILMLASLITNSIKLVLLSSVLEKLVIGSAVVMAIILQSEVRRLLEDIGQGKIWHFFKTPTNTTPKADSMIEEIVDAVKELSQNRIGALMILETDTPIDERDFKEPGVRLNADVSKELLQTIFQKDTVLHDGAVFIRGKRLVSAGVILPVSGRTASRQLGTRHRAAMGITEKVTNCLCVVVSEETGSISLVEKGIVNRPLTSIKLREMLENKFTPVGERMATSTNIRTVSKHILVRLTDIIRRRGRKSSSSDDKK